MKSYKGVMPPLGFVMMSFLKNNEKIIFLNEVIRIVYTFVS